MALYTKPIKLPPENTDGLRISIMSRHTLDDGITPDLNISPSLYDLHWKELAPSPRLIGSYKRGEIDWPEFKYRFLEQMHGASAQEKIKELIKLAINSPVTILCVEENPQFCHRKLIAEICHRQNAALEINVG